MTDLQSSSPPLSTADLAQMEQFAVNASRTQVELSVFMRRINRRVSSTFGRPGRQKPDRIRENSQNPARYRTPRSRLHDDQGLGPARP